MTITQRKKMLMNCIKKSGLDVHNSYISQNMSDVIKLFYSLLEPRISNSMIQKFTREMNKVNVYSLTTFMASMQDNNYLFIYKTSLSELSAVTYVEQYCGVPFHAIYSIFKDYLVEISLFTNSVFPEISDVRTKYMQFFFVIVLRYILCAIELAERYNISLNFFDKDITNKIKIIQKCIEQNSPTTSIYDDSISNEFMDELYNRYSQLYHFFSDKDISEINDFLDKNPDIAFLMEYKKNNIDKKLLLKKVFGMLLLSISDHFKNTEPLNCLKINKLKYDKKIVIEI